MNRRSFLFRVSGAALTVLAFSPSSWSQYVPFTFIRRQQQTIAPPPGSDQLFSISTGSVSTWMIG